jgi:hypothetical protein
MWYFDIYLADKKCGILLFILQMKVITNPNPITLSKFIFLFLKNILITKEKNILSNIIKMALGLLIAVIIILIVLTSKDRKGSNSTSNVSVLLAPPKSQTLAPEVMAAAAPTTEGFSPEMGVNYAGVAKDSNNWSEDLKDLSLDPSIAKSHKRFVEERLKVSNGAEKKPELDHMININSWVGLRRPDFTRVKEGKDARVVSSLDFSGGDSLIKPQREFRF